MSKIKVAKELAEIINMIHKEDMMVEPRAIEMIENLRVDLIADHFGQLDELSASDQNRVLERMKPLNR